MKSVKNSAKKAAKAVASAVSDVVANATVKAVTLALDVQNSHKLRMGALEQGCDIMTTHSFKEASKGYLEQLLGMNRDELFKTLEKGEVRLLIVNGVGHLIRVDKAGTFYGRNGALEYVRDFNEKQMLHGNIASLRALYGDKVEVLTEQEARKRFDEQKEIVTRKVGTGKNAQTVTGRVIALGSKDSHSYSVVAVEEKGKLFFHNCESGRNEYNKKHRYAQLSVAKV